MRTYLEYRMKQEGVSRADLQKILGVSEKTIRNKLSGETDFSWGEAKSIRNNFSPRMISSNFSNRRNRGNEKIKERDIIKKHNEWLEAHPEHKKVPGYMWLCCGRDDFIA